MLKSDLDFSYANFHIGVIPQLSIERSKKLERLKRAIVEGTYQINAKELANKLIEVIILADGADPDSGMPLSLSR